MMSSAKRDGELVADLAAERWTLREAQMMRVARRSPAVEASVLRHISEMVAITEACAAPAGPVHLYRKRCELPRPPGGYDRVLKRVGIQYCRISSTTAGMSL